MSRGPTPEFYKHVDEVAANPEVWSGRRLRIHGTVACVSVDGPVLSQNRIGRKACDAGGVGGGQDGLYRRDLGA